MTAPFDIQTLESLVDQAKALAARGYRVHPVGPDKAPLMKGWPDKASTDPQEINAMPWDRATHVGVATGGEERLLVFDIDTDKYPPEVQDSRSPTQIGESEVWNELDKALDGWKAAQPKRGVLATQTPSGGYHVYVTVPDAALSELPNRTDVWRTKRKDGVKLDIRGDGGYVVAAGPGYKTISRGRSVDELVQIPLADLGE